MQNNSRIISIRKTNGCMHHHIYKQQQKDVRRNTRKTTRADLRKDIHCKMSTFDLESVI